MQKTQIPPGLIATHGTPDGADKGNSSIISLQYVYTLQQAAVIFEHFGKQAEAGFAIISIHKIMLAKVNFIITVTVSFVRIVITACRF